jgi:hypothetical protein
MTDCFSLRFAALAGAALLSAAAATPADAQVRIDRDQTGRVVAITGLPTGSGCVRGTGTGRVVDRKVEKGELQGFTFNEPPYDDSYINLPAAYDIRDRAAYARLQAAFDDLFRKGARLKVRSVACGAAGRIVKLVSATLIEAPPAPKAAAVPAPAPVPPAPAPAAPAASPAVPPPAPAAAEPMDALLRSPDSPAKPVVAPKVDEPPAPAATQAKPAAGLPASAADAPKTATETPPDIPRKPSRWQLVQPTKVQVDLRIQSEDRAFRFLLSCQKGRNGGVEVSNWFLPPGNWSISNSPTPASIDGRPQRWQVGGADEGLVFSDGEFNGMATLSPGARDQLARGQRFVVSGRMDRGGRPREAVFDISGSEEIFASFDARCRGFRR